VDRSYYTGISFVEVTKDIAQALDFDDIRGLLVAEVDRNSPAEKAGLQPYDLITAIQDELVADQDDYVARVFDFRPGDTVTYHILRDNRELELSLQIGRAED
ncbi:MAG: PDZ domain-containing protein, partial [Rhodothermaceae bacterium]|nr:PDZ domain-containing protein [Rhodothermaceae bacterium]